MKRFLWIIPATVVIVAGIVALFTQKDYGWNWDSFQHLARGQAYYRYFTTDKTDNLGVVPYDGRLSFYEKTAFDFAWAAKMTIGHPPTNDIILAAWNQLFYKRLGLVEDLVAYHLYGVLLTWIAAIVIALWSYEISGWFGATVAMLAYWGFPLLFAEEHFNIKDPAVFSYNIISLYLFWLGVTRKKPLFILLSAIVAGVSLGTKFNIIFLLPVLVLWLLWYTRGNVSRWWRHVSVSFRIALVITPVIVFSIFFFTYPALWSNPVKNVLSVVKYYQDIGGSRCPYVPATGLWFIRCTDWQTVHLFLVQIPIPTILLAGVGSVAALATVGRYGFAPFLWLIYMATMTLRVVLPINSLYGSALRQIMEIIGPLSLLAGFGADWARRRLGSRAVIMVFIIVLYVPVFWTMMKLHPNENLYTNLLEDLFWKNTKQQLVNGVVSYGNAYKQGIDWINTHAESGANVSLVTGIGSAVPYTMFRPDLHYGAFWSGYAQQGEYLLEITDAESSAQFFPYLYASRILVPVYEKILEGFPIVRVWKNDAAHVRPELRQTVPVTVQKAVWDKDEIVIQLQHMTRLQSLSITTTATACRNSVMNTYVLVSPDGSTYRRMYETIQELAVFDAKILRYPFSGEAAAFIKLFFYGSDDCDASLMHIEVMGFK